MLDDFKRALVRVQTDYGFYIDCQANPAAALAEYELTAQERAALTDPEMLSDVLIKGVEGPKLLPRITITIAGSHDWINRALPAEAPKEPDQDAEILAEVAAIRRAETDEERTAAAVRLMGLVG